MLRRVFGNSKLELIKAISKKEDGYFLTISFAKVIWTKFLISFFFNYTEIKRKRDISRLWDGINVIEI